VVLRECCCGKRHRAFTQTQAVDGAKATAKHANGVLEFALPKKGATATKNITID
jgi:HSP20 family molecular chaperone IbpA